MTKREQQELERWEIINELRRLPLDDAQRIAPETLRKISRSSAPEEVR